MTEKNIVPLPDGMSRMETGTVQFGKDDWPGVFIRGDNALAFALHLEHAIRLLEEEECHLITLMGLRGLLGTLSGCQVK